jgi:hypothetical protein
LCLIHSHTDEFVEMNGCAVPYQAMGGIENWNQFLYECRDVIEMYEGRMDGKTYVFVRVFMYIINL